ncbi:putative histone acetylase complex subunit [Phaeomoniella chlamydospora]|uniref:Chromatin modification-related protein EAF3 n=1 Tax=Phaeomoniella chlamydospora TaxID=158046 RepID=A0A0G2ED91_PHACM|nr:putative histone acetylase complex subunit [Phaeomoniella chlamydospora]
MAPANTSAFNKDEKVFCFHHELLYEARIVDVRRVDEKDKNSPWEYLVHYKGWKNTWDDWVPQDRLRKLTDEYRELAANLKKDLIAQDSRRQPAQTKSTKKGGKDERGSEGRDSAAPSSKRRKEKDNEIETTLACSKKRKASGMSADAPDDISGPSNSPTEGNKDGKILDFWAIDRMLGGRPPRDPPEYLSRGTNDLGLFWAPCPSGTLNYEQRKIDNEGGVARPVKTDYSLLNSDSLVPYEKSKPMKKKQKPEDQTPDGEDRALDEELLHMEKPDRGDKHATFKCILDVEDHFMGKPMINMYIPDTIKGYLVDDWEYVTKNYQLVPLPAKYPVNWIMDEYFDQEKVNRRLGSPEAQFLEEVRIGIKEWFKRALGKTLLYRFEREQYSDVSAWWEDVTDPNDKWYGRGVGDCYGVEHLCRLLGISSFRSSSQLFTNTSFFPLQVKIPEYISHTNMDAQSINTMRKELDQFMSWLARNAPEFMCKEYTQATQEYIERATGSSGR